MLVASVFTRKAKNAFPVFYPFPDKYKLQINIPNT